MNPLRCETEEGVKKKVSKGTKNPCLFGAVSYSYCHECHSLCNFLMFEFNDLTPLFMGENMSIIFRTGLSVDLIP